MAQDPEAVGSVSGCGPCSCWEEGGISGAAVLALLTHLGARAPRGVVQERCACVHATHARRRADARARTRAPTHQPMRAACARSAHKAEGGCSVRP